MADEAKHQVDFWFDPVCPWAWITSRWVLEVAELRPIETKWHVMSLAYLNQGRDDVEDRYKDPRVQSWWGPVRVCIAAEQLAGNKVMLPLYNALGTRLHLEKLPPDEETVVAALAEVGLPADLISAMSTRDYDDALIASHHSGMDLVGTEVGTPVIAVEGVAFFGPVLTPRPHGKAAADLWDAVLVLAKTDGFFELKRSRTRGPIHD
jgi:2-hydroxychromene-2-carboxylate isomerase